MCKKLNLFRSSILCLILVISFFFLTDAYCQTTYQWTVMVYMDADNDLEAAAIADFLKMASVVNAAGDIAIVVQLDRSDGFDTSYENWSECARFVIEQGDTPVLENADYDWDGGQYNMEVNMGDTQTLVDFVDWATDVEIGCPADKYALILWNAEGLYSSGDAVKELKESLPIYIDLVGFDADLMSMLETAYEIKDSASVMVASQKTEPENNWPYDDILEALVEDTQMTPIEFGYEIVEKYGQFHEGEITRTLSAVRLQEEEGGGKVTTTEVGEDTIQEVSAAGLDVTGGIQAVADAVSDFADTVLNQQHDDWDKIFLSQQRSGWYLPSSNHDLIGFMQGIIDYAENESLQTAAQNVIDAFDSCLIDNYSSDTDIDHGLSIYFPMWCWEDVYRDYNDTNLLFVEDTFWDEFLIEYVGTELVPGHSGPKTYSKTIPGGTTASSYVMVSTPVFPYDLDDMDPLAILGDDLGTYDKNIWRLFRWNSMLNPANYEEYPFLESAPDEGGWFPESCYVIPGKSYWLISRDTKDIDVTGQLYPTFMPYPVLLSPGWNQIGTPFNFDIDFDTVWVFGTTYELDGAGIAGHSASTAIYEGFDYDLSFALDATSDGNTLTSKTLWKYANGNYSASAIMRPGEGYWIYNKKNSDWIVFLMVNPIRSTILSGIYADSLERTLTTFGQFSEETPPPPPGGMDPEPEDSGSGGGSGCFIATACFGSPMAGEVNILRNFRDRYLLSNPLGQVLVSVYYKYSPKVADFIAKHDFLKTVVRMTLYPIVKACPHTN